MNRPGRRRARGMTLIELMMAFAILLTGLTVIFALILAGTRSHRRAIKETEAALCGASVLADLRAQLARGQMPTRESGGDFTPSDDFPSCKYRWTIIPVGLTGIKQGGNAAPGEYFVRVKVRWSDKGDDKSIELNTLMYCSGGK
jgi:type II secretory pathway pseudopilin PulG